MTRLPDAERRALLDRGHADDRRRAREDSIVVLAEYVEAVNG